MNEKKEKSIVGRLDRIIKLLENNTDNKSTDWVDGNDNICPGCDRKGTIESEGNGLLTCVHCRWSNSPWN